MRSLNIAIAVSSVFMILEIQAAPARNSANPSATNSLTLAGDTAKQPAEKAERTDGTSIKKPIEPSSGRGHLVRSASKTGFGTKLLWYIPNRIIDLLDIFRFRGRIGPGLAANVRVTDYGSLYLGKYYSVYAGLPGPRDPYYIRYPVGVENLNGMVIAGVDATDDTAYGPAYGKTEVDVGVHLLIVGADIGMDPMELSDFFAGLMMIDLQRDDYPRARMPEPEFTSGVSYYTDSDILANRSKPSEFDGFCHRLDYLHTNVHQYVNGQIRSVDEYFSPDFANRIAGPDSRLRLGVYAEFVKGNDFDMEFHPDIDLDVEIPNIKRNFRLFVQSGRSDDLPGQSLTDSSGQNLTMGARRKSKKYDISTDLGVRANWYPRAYARITWHPKYEYGYWSIRPQQRFFADTKDRVGSLSTLYVDRWLGPGREYYAGSISSAKIKKNFDELSWEQTLRVGRVLEMVNDRAYVGGYKRRDVASGGDISASIFGDDEEINTYRLTVCMRRPLYSNWIFWEVEPGIEWDDDNDFDSAFRITLGIDMLFWGPKYK